jgi:hypothetical protein
MAALSYMQRRKSGTYEFRKRLPEALAGKPVPSHMRDAFADLINPKTRCFKREVSQLISAKRNPRSHNGRSSRGGNADPHV